jgi:ubiquinone/menaquinone biosynthesis C-methylase UbiE
VTNVDETEDYRVAHDYWMREPAINPDFPGIAAFGGGGRTELLYRHYYECQHLRGLIRFNAQMSVLDLGCGSGRWIESLAPLVSRYVAVDYSQAMLDVASRRVRSLGLSNVTLLCAPAQDYAPGERFDVVYLSGVTQYLHDRDLEPMLRKLVGQIKPGGVIVDRSTVHQRTRTASAQPSYFCIYRTADELIALYSRAGAENTYHAKSYPFLSLPAGVQNLLNRPRIHGAIGATVPASLWALRAGAWAAGLLLRPAGELTEYSHDFFAFSVPSPP